MIAVGLYKLQFLAFAHLISKEVFQGRHELSIHVGEMLGGGRDEDQIPRTSAPRSSRV